MALLTHAYTPLHRAPTPGPSHVVPKPRSEETISGVKRITPWEKKVAERKRMEGIKAREKALKDEKQARDDS